MYPTVPYGSCEHPERPSAALCWPAEGFVVDVAHDGVDGLHLAREGGYDAVVLDLMLPGLSGYQVCERLRAERNWVPVLILSAKDGEYDQADGLDLGADDYM